MERVPLSEKPPTREELRNAMLTKLNLIRMGETKLGAIPTRVMVAILRKLNARSASS